MSAQSAVASPVAMVHLAVGESRGWTSLSSKSHALPSRGDEPFLMTCLDIFEETLRRLALRGHRWDRPRA